MRRNTGSELALYTETLDPSRPTPWSKIVLLRRLAASYDLLLWLDADLVIVDRSLDIASEQEEERFLYLVEHQTQEGRMPNSGVMLLRGGGETIAFLDDVYAQEDLVHHRWWERRDLPAARVPARPDRAGHAHAAAHRPHEADLAAWNAIRNSPVSKPRIRHYPGYSLKTTVPRSCHAIYCSAASDHRRAHGRQSSAVPGLPLKKWVPVGVPLDGRGKFGVSADGYWDWLALVAL